MESEPPNQGFYSFFIAVLIYQGWGLIAGLFVLLLLLMSSALISGSEVAFFSLSPTNIQELESDKKESSQRILWLKNQPRTLLATILISNNFINIAIVIVSEYLLRKSLPEAVYDNWSLGIQSIIGDQFSVELISRGINFLITVIGVTFLLLLFGEIAPKIYANVNNKAFARFMSIPLSALRTIFYPVSSVLVNWSNRLEDRVERNRIKSSTNKEELGKAIELAVSNEKRSEREVEILKGIIHFGDVVVKQIMKPRVDVVAVDTDTSYKEILNIVRKSGYSRIPVYKEDFDNIIGILYVKDLLGHTNEKQSFNWLKLIRENILYIPESKKINDLLKEFQLKRMHLAIVVDEYGGSSGIVTLEDIMEEVIGEIKDEFDDEQEVDYLKIDDNNYIFEGKSQLNDVCKIIGLESDVFDDVRGESDTLAGLFLEVIGSMPKVDKEITYKNFKFKIVSVSKKRIEKINVSIL